jgi:uncharacterized membrane protein YczE
VHQESVIEARAAWPLAGAVPTAFPLRVARCVGGLVVCGLGVALLVAADIGLAPWDVLHKGISRHTGLSIGTVIIAVGFAVLLAGFVLLRVRPGLGTVLNAILIGATYNVVGDYVPAASGIVPRVVEMAGGVVAFGLGTALYIGAGLGPGPRDGLMTGIAARGHSLRLVRTLIELTVLVVGWLLGGSVGLGTAAFALGIGPLVHFFLGVLGTQTGVRLAPGRPPLR